MKTNVTSNSSLKPKETTDNPSLKATLCLVFVVRKLRSTRKKRPERCGLCIFQTPTWDTMGWNPFQKLMLKLSLINNILPTMPPACLPSVISNLNFYDIVLLHVHFATFFSNFCTWVLGAHIFQGTNTHSPAAINLTPTFCRIFLLANHSLLRTSVLAWFGSKQFQLVSTYLVG